MELHTCCEAVFSTAHPLGGVGVGHVEEEMQTGQANLGQNIHGLDLLKGVRWKGQRFQISVGYLCNAVKSVSHLVDGNKITFLVGVL